MPRFSLRTLLVAGAIVPVAIYALAKADVLISGIVSMIAVLVLLAMAIVAWVDRGPRKAFAGGFLIAAIGYGFIVWYFPWTNLPGSQRLPTMLALEELHDRIVIEVRTGVQGYMPTYFPDLQFFHHVGQIYWCMILGMLGGWFATFVERRRTREEQADVPRI